MEQTPPGETTAPPPADTGVPFGWKLFFGLAPPAFVLGLIYDDEISVAVTAHRPPHLDPVIVFITDWKCEFSILLGVSLVLLALRRWRPVAFTWVTFLIGEVIGTALKYAIGRKRPYVTHADVLNLVKEGTPSFPSNHSIALFTAALAIGWCYPRVRIFALAWAAIIGFTRIYVGVHYTTDVLGGAFLAVLVVWVARRGFGEWARER